MVHCQNAAITFPTVVSSLGLVVFTFFAPFLPVVFGHLIVGRWTTRHYHNSQIVRDPHHCEIYLVSNLSCWVHMMAENEIMGWIAYTSNQETWNLELVSENGQEKEKGI